MTFSIDWGSYVISVPLILLSVWAGTKYLTKKYVDQKFSKNLEDHKHDLQKVMEINKFDIQRKMQDFSLYTAKKHEAYTTLYRLFLEADGNIGRLMGYKQTPDFKTYSYGEIEQLLEKNQIGETEKNYILTNWEHRNNDKSVLDKLKYIMDRVELSLAKEYQRKAHNEFYFSKLYLSEKVDKLCGELSVLLNSVCIDLEYYYSENADTATISESMRSISENNEKISNNFKDLRIAMQEELSVGYYKY